MKSLARILGGILNFFGIGIIQPFPSGMTVDKSANFGIFGMWSNLNAYAKHSQAITTAGTNSTLTAAQAIANLLVMAAGASGGFTITLPSTAAIITALGPTIPTDSTFTKFIWIKNDTIGQTGTLTAGDASTTITGVATIATATSRLYALTVTGTGTVTYENVGTVSL